jgi:putative ABC transport system ATP-binding protein
MNTTLRAEHLTCSFGEGALRTFALRDVSLEIGAGEIGLLIGPSGSGKSTLVSVLSGLHHPDSGTVHALGEDLWAMTDREREEFRRRHCGFIFQGYNLFPALTALQQLEMVLEWGGMGDHNGRGARRAAEETLARLGLGGKFHLRPQQLSGGEKQRVAVARALVKRPDLLFADEPTAALDWRHGEQVVRMLQEIAHEFGTTVVLVSHDPRIVPLCDNVHHLEDGVITDPSELSTVEA